MTLFNLTPAKEETIGESRCTARKHVCEFGSAMCDCKALVIGQTVAKNAVVVTLLRPSIY